jgi:hypothetical protein
MLKKLSKKYIPMCWFKIMLITICCPRKSPYGVVVQWLKTLFFNVKVRSSSPYTCNLGYLGYLGDLIR